jgi:sugar phosphate isomerase/epimerase
MTVNPRLSIDSMCTFTWPFEQELALWSELGVRHVGLLINKVDDAPERKLKQLDDAGIRISTLIVGGFQLADRSNWAATQAAQRAAIDMVAEHRGLSIYFTSGRTVRCDWDEDFALLAEAVAPTVAYGRERGVIAALEPTTRTSSSFVTTLADGIDVAERTGLGIVADFANVWAERGLPQTIRRAAPHVALWQIDDIVIGGTGRPAPGGRAHIGEGELPLERMMRDVLASGYREVFDLEVVPADFTQPIDEAELRRGIAAASALLDTMGVQ